MKARSLLPFACGLLLSQPAHSETIPINIGVGPAMFQVPEQLEVLEENEEQAPFYGLKLHIKAVVDRKLLKKHKSKIPPQFQKALEKTDEIRVGHLFIPDSIMLGMRAKEAGKEFFGATWRPISLGVPIKMGPARLSLGLGLIGTYAFVNTGAYRIVDTEAEGDEITYRSQRTHFLRPGGDLRGELEIKFSDSFLTSFGWSSAYYIPQNIGGDIFAATQSPDKTIFRIHQAYVTFHYRFPFYAKI